MAISQSFLSDPCGIGEEVAPGNSFTECRMIHVGTGGSLELTLANGNEVTLICVDGQLLPVRATAIGAGSTASNIIVFR